MNYYKYWGLSQPPFDNVPDPKMYWPQNPCLEDAISEILFAVEEGNECLAVIVGDIGTGKTLALRVLLHELDPEKYRIAVLTNPNLALTQMLREIIGQLENKKVSVRWKDHLQEEFNQILYRSANEGKRVVIFIDEANVMSAANLQSLRLLTNMQDDTQNMVTFVLAGQKELARKLERPSMENLYQRIGVYCKVKGLDTPELVSKYIGHRLKKAGAATEIFTESAVKAIWKHSRGIPRVINKICKLCLKAGETNQLRVIEKNVVTDLARMFKKGYFSEKKESDPRPDSAIDSEKRDLISDEQDKDATDQLRIMPAVTLADHLGNVTGTEIETENDQDTIADKIQETQIWGEELLRDIPPEILERVSHMESRQISRLAGQLAAKQLRENGTLKSVGDPIFYWEKLRNEIAEMLHQLAKANCAKSIQFQQS